MKNIWLEHESRRELKIKLISVGDKKSPTYYLSPTQVKASEGIRGSYGKSFPDSGDAMLASNTLE